jgi:signal transduction histidine kinase
MTPPIKNKSAPAAGTDPAAKLAEARLKALELENERLRAAQGAAEEAVRQYVTSMEKLVEKNRQLERAREDSQAIFDQAQAMMANVERLSLYHEETRREVAALKETLEAAHNYRRSVLDSLPVGVLSTDLKGAIISVNRAAEAMLGRDGAALLRRNVNDVIGSTLIPAPTPARGPGDALAYRRADGETFQLRVSVTPMIEGEQHPGYVVNVEDVTLLKKLEEQSARRSRFTVMGEMAANIAHEIRNPLGSIELFASLVKKGLPEDGDALGHLNHISSAVTSMNHIISNVLEYSKPRAVTLKEMDLHALLRELEGFFSVHCRQNGVELALALAAPDAGVRADRELLKQVFHNLLLNAVQAMPEGGRLTLSTRVLAVSNVEMLSRLGRAPGPDGGVLNALEVTVRDNGAGMMPDVRARIFDPFFTTKARGTGLGLAITHTIVEAHQATISVDSQPGQGTAFSLMFPLARG